MPRHALNRSSNLRHGTTEKRPRSLYRCHNCRDLKRACNPVDRNWEAGQRCSNCIERSLPCGPNINAHQYHRGRSGDVVGTTSLPPASVAAYHSQPLPQTPPTAVLAAASRPILLPKPPPIKSGVNEVTYRHSFRSQPASSLLTTENGHDPFQAQETDRSQLTPSEYIQEKLDNGEFDLGKQSLLTHYIIKRRQAAVASLPFRDDSASNTLRLSLGRDYNLACERFAGSLRNQLDFVNLAPPDQQELRLRRLLEFVRPLHQNHCINANGWCANTSQTTYEVPKKLTGMHRSILKAMVLVCDKSGDNLAADRYCQELFALPRPAQPEKDDVAIFQRLEASFTTQSAALNDSWRALDIEGLEGSKSNSATHTFSAEHLKLLSSLPKAVIQPMLQHREDDSRDRAQRSPLHLAVESADPSLVRLVYESYERSKRALEARDICHMTPLLLAASIGEPEIFKMLYELGADREALDLFHRDVFVISSENGNDKIVMFLLDKGMEPNLGYYDPRSTPLYAASERGKLSTVQLLLAGGANPLQKSFGRTPREIAESKGHHEIAKRLGAAEGELRAARNPPITDHTLREGSPIWARPRFGISSQTSSESAMLALHSDAAGLFPPQASQQRQTSLNSLLLSTERAVHASGYTYAGNQASPVTGGAPGCSPNEYFGSALGPFTQFELSSRALSTIDQVVAPKPSPYIDEETRYTNEFDEYLQVCSEDEPPDQVLAVSPTSAP